MAYTIKDVLFSFINENNGVVNFEDATKLILEKFPNSRWQKTHWVWYKYQISSPRGKYYGLFSEQIRKNLTQEKHSNYSNISTDRSEKISTKTNNHCEFKDCSESVEETIAIALGKVCYHIHPDIVNKIVKSNIEFKDEFKSFCGNLDSDAFFYNGSDCVFPGVRRCINKEKSGKWKYKINTIDNTILDDNIFPRHIWAFLSRDKPYEGNMWKKSGLAKFELAHIFGHKEDEKELEKKVFSEFNKNKMPYAFFTSAANVVLIPNGLMKPTDKFESIKIAFYKRYITLYGENFYAESGFKDELVPEWYNNIKWLDPVLPEDWEDKIDNLLKL
jgi:hypothetical protein